MLKKPYWKFEEITCHAEDITAYYFYRTGRYRRHITGTRATYNNPGGSPRFEYHPVRGRKLPPPQPEDKSWWIDIYHNKSMTLEDLTGPRLKRLHFLIALGMKEGSWPPC